MTVGGERLGATVHADGTAFVVASGVAERIELCLFEADGTEGERVDLAPDDAGLWRATVAGVGHGRRYGYRVHGPGDPASGHACDPAKLLVDPAARRVAGDLRWAPELTAPGVDSSPFVPRSVVVRPGAPIPAVDRPGTPWDRTVVYEAHVGHLTARHPLVPVDDRGRYRGLAAPALVDHLQRLGATAVELLPLQHFVSERFLAAEGRRNVWGYNPLAWGAPHAGYASPGGDPVGELRAAVADLHRAGIEVWLDVVYNHTCEGALGVGPILSWRGFDNAATYRLLPGLGGLVDDDVTGCGNAVDTRSPLVRRLVVETLVRWVEELGIDGFRFDLAATLIRGDDGPTAGSAFLADVAAEPALADVKLVAEPWDTGPDGYAVGAFPAPWREWNDRFRDDVRDLWRNEPGRWPAVGRRVTGSSELFRASGRPATTSINAVATHDGFTVADLVTYDQPVGGGHGQRSWSGGLAGPTADAAVRAGRRIRQRALLGTAVLAQGVPLISAGDELGRTQGGRADGYTLEPGEWGVPWPEADWDLAAWLGEALRLRRTTSALRWPAWVDEEHGLLAWRRADGEPMSAEDWTDEQRTALALVAGEEAVGEPRYLVLLATGTEPVAFVLPEGRWEPVLDARLPRGVPVGVPAREHRVEVAAPALVVLRRA